MLKSLPTNKTLKHHLAEVQTFLKHLNVPFDSKYLNPLSFIALFAIIGTFLLVISHASTPYASIDANTGVLAAGAVSQTCSGADDGSCVVFGSNGAPVLRLSGTTIAWNAISGVTAYKGATSNGPASNTSRTTTYQELGNVTTWSPTSDCGNTDYYGVAAELPAGDQWSAEVSITWPACSGSDNGKLIISANNTIGWGPNSNEPSALFKGIGVTYTRVDVGMGTGASLLATAISEGMHPFPTITGGTTDGNCNGVAPSTIGSAVSGLVSTLEADHITTLEICNESYLSETDSAYAAQYNAAHAALAGTGIKALAVATALSTTCGAGDASPSWIPDVIHDLPGGSSEVDGWTIHPYGPLSGAEACSSAPNGYGWEDVPDWHTIAVNAGSNAPWYITEVGQCLGNLSGESGCNGPVSEQVQATDMTQYLNDTLTKYTWVVFLNWYAACDDSTGEFGLVNREGGSPGGAGACDAGTRPAFTSLGNWITANKNSLGD
jgi:hypothetical protein